MKWHKKKIKSKVGKGKKKKVIMEEVLRKWKKLRKGCPKRASKTEIK